MTRDTFAPYIGDRPPTLEELDQDLEKIAAEHPRRRPPRIRPLARRPSHVMLSFPGGPERVLVAGAPHPNEPIGMASVLALARHIAEHPEDRSDLTAAALVSVIPLVATLDRLSMPLLYAVALALGTASTLQSAASLAAIPVLAAPGHLHQAQARLTAVITIAGAIGTTLGTLQRIWAAHRAGALTTLISIRAVMAIGVLVLLLPAGVLWRSPVRHLPAMDEGVR